MTKNVLLFHQQTGDQEPRRRRLLLALPFDGHRIRDRPVVRDHQQHRSAVLSAGVRQHGGVGQSAGDAHTDNGVPVGHDDGVATVEDVLGDADRLHAGTTHQRNYINNLLKLQRRQVERLQVRQLVGGQFLADVLQCGHRRLGVGFHAHGQRERFDDGGGHVIVVNAGRYVGLVDGICFVATDHRMAEH